MRFSRKTLVESNNFKTMRIIFFYKSESELKQEFIEQKKEKHKRITNGISHGGFWWVFKGFPQHSKFV